jgi:hypothetical protein
MQRVRTPQDICQETRWEDHQTFCQLMVLEDHQTFCQLMVLAGSEGIRHGRATVQTRPLMTLMALPRRCTSTLRTTPRRTSIKS